MTLVRSIFEIDPDGMRETIDIVNEATNLPSRAVPGTRRVSTDLGGEFYTWVLEAEYTSLAEFEADSENRAGGDDWRM